MQKVKSRKRMQTFSLFFFNAQKVVISKIFKSAPKPTTWSTRRFFPHIRDLNRRRPAKCEIKNIFGENKNKILVALAQKK